MTPFRSTTREPVWSRDTLEIQISGHVRAIKVTRIVVPTGHVWASESGDLEQQLVQASVARKDLEESSKHLKSLEKQMKSLKQERDDVQKVL